jgi:hypothetical protein
VFAAGCYTGNYCKRHAKDTLDDRRFQLAGLVLCLQWDTRDTPPRVSTRASRLLAVGIRSDTPKEPIDSALADERAGDSSMDARDSSWIDANDSLACPLNGQDLLVKQNNAPAGKSAAAVIVPHRQRMHRPDRRSNLSFSPGVIRVLRQIIQQRKERR